MLCDLTERRIVNACLVIPFYLAQSQKHWIVLTII